MGTTQKGETLDTTVICGFIEGLKIAGWRRCLPAPEIGGIKDGGKDANLPPADHRQQGGE
ncbi:MAG: hypothetical protein SLRJCFUN_001146 [Candidatus Fervidibacter sp.]